MTTYCLKYTDEHGDWFYRAPGRWSDAFADAFRFTDLADAECEAFASAHRLGPTDGYHGMKRVRIIEMRAGS